MNVQQTYNIWAEQYDANNNKTRDLEAYALRDILKNISFDTCLEIGCGTGKNTDWLITKSKEITAIDLSEEMLKKAKEKILSPQVTFQQFDINQHWTFVSKQYNLVSFSLVLEHIENLDHIFKETSNAVSLNGYVYIGELHPFKQYTGSKARFDTEEGQHIATCFNHHVSDFTINAKKYGLEIIDINEYFDDNDKNNIPRILSILFKKN